MNAQALRNYQRYLLYAMVALLPLILTPGGKDIFRLGKEVYAQILALGVVCLAAGEMVQTRRLPGIPPALLGALTAFCFWCAAATTWARVRPLALYALFNLILFVLFTLAISRLLDPRTLRFVILLNLAPATLTAIYTLIQYYGFDPLLITPQGFALSGRENAGGLVGDVNTAGCYLAVSLVLAVNSIFLERSSLRRGAALAGTTASLMGLVCTQTITSLGAAAAALGLLVSLDTLLFFKTSGGSRRLWLGAVGLLLFLGTSGALFALNNPKFRERLQTRYHDLRHGDWARLTSYRAPMFAVTWNMAMERPWLGYGLQSFQTEFFAGKLRHRPGRLISMPQSIESTPRQAHNEYLQVWLELGAVGLILLVAVLASLGALAVTAFRKGPTPEHRYLAVSLIAAYVTLLTASLSFFPAHLALTAVWAAIVSGALVATGIKPGGWVGAPNVIKPRPLSASLEEEDRSTAAAPAWVAIGVALVGGYALLSPLSANEKIEQATTLVERVARGDEPNTQAYLARSLALLNEARRQNSLESQIYQTSGTAHWFLYQFDEALADFSRAALLDPSPEAMTNIGEAYRALDKPAYAAKAFEKALAYNPNFEKARSAQALIEQLKNGTAGR